MEDLKLGQLITTPRQRDAIHIAVAPVVAGEVLRAGQAVAFEAGSTERVRAYGTTIGIIDPFLTERVREGQQCWMFLYPNTITSLRHEWTHPAFAVPVRDESEQWIRDYAARIPLDYETLMSGADDWVRDRARGGYGEYLCFGGLLEGEWVPDEFWPHYEKVRGVKVPDDNRGSFFSCSC